MYAAFEEAPDIIASVRTLADAMAVRRIRNELRRFLTRDPSAIGPIRQAWWWWTQIRPGRILTWLVLAGAKPVGYGLLRYEGRRWWVTGGLLPEARGRGLGRALFKFLTFAAAARSGESWLEVRGDNIPARRLYESLGYKEIGERTKAADVAEWGPQAVLTMVYRPPDVRGRWEREKAHAD